MLRTKNLNPAHGSGRIRSSPFYKRTPKIGCNPAQLPLAGFNVHQKTLIKKGLERIRPLPWAGFLTSYA